MQFEHYTKHYTKQNMITKENQNILKHQTHSYLCVLGHASHPNRGARIETVVRDDV